ncbi:MAG: N-acetylmuramoyl-L-alanine amidase [Lachnospiraceae bacterium]|nr:N-acetylmuramoyl-L-alanine amidase [Lachnospiraceae bacterium]
MKLRSKTLAVLLILGLLTGCASTSDTANTTAPKVTIPSDRTIEVIGSEEPVIPITLPPLTTQEEATLAPETLPEVTEQPTEPAAPTDPVTPAETPAPPAVTTLPAGGTHTIVIDPGHGGIDWGTYHNDYVEKDLSLKIGLYLQQILTTQYTGMNVVLTRTEDMHYSDHNVDDLQKRCDIARDYGAEMLVSLHFNADGGEHVSYGAQVWASCQPGLQTACDSLGELVLYNLSLLGIRNRKVGHRLSETQFNADGTPKDYYAINRHCAEYGIPSIIIEHLFIDNVNELQFIDTEDKIYAIALADAKAIASYFNLSHV